MNNLNIAVGRNDIPVLTTAQRNTLLRRLDLPDQLTPNLANLTLLQWRYLCHSVFHNLHLLASADGYPAPLSAEASLRSVLDGHGGPCHVQTIGFLCLLRSLGFSAHLAGAHINAPLDHLVIIVHLSQEFFVCDVGNGHPYRQPFPLQHSLTQAWQGWKFRTEPTDDGGLRLQRLVRHKTRERWKTVYHIDPRPRDFAAFAPTLRQHHQQIGFGPFLANLRAVRITKHALLSLRNGCYERYSAYGRQARPVVSAEAADALLRDVFGLHHAPVSQALRVYQRHQAQPWTQAETPPSLLISLTATGYARHLSAFGQLLRRDFTDDSGLLMVENSVDAADRVANQEQVAQLRRTGVRVDYLDDGHYARAIAAGRRAQVRGLARRIADGHKPDIVWMIDDDLALRYLTIEAGKLTLCDAEGIGARLISLYRNHPQVSVLLGGVSGDPPIRPDAVLRTQLFDLLANLEWFAALSPDANYPAPEQEAHFALADYYYDLSESGGAHLFTPFRWLPQHGCNGSVRAQFFAYLQAARGIAVGKAVTRPLLYRTDDSLRPSVLRGGNTLFFDIDTALAHAYPSTQINGISTRRADMIGAALLQRFYPAHVYQSAFSLLHQRDVRDVGQTQRQAVWESLCSEFFGVLLAHAVITGGSFDFAQAARQRATRIAENLRWTAHYLDLLEHAQATESLAWWKLDKCANATLKDLLQHLKTELAVYLQIDAHAQTLPAALADLAANPQIIAALQQTYADLHKHTEQWQQETARLSRCEVHDEFHA